MPHRSNCEQRSHVTNHGFDSTTHSTHFPPNMNERTVNSAYRPVTFTRCHPLLLRMLALHLAPRSPLLAATDAPVSTSSYSFGHRPARTSLPLPLEHAGGWADAVGGQSGSRSCLEPGEAHHIHLNSTGSSIHTRNNERWNRAHSTLDRSC